MKQGTTTTRQRELQMEKEGVRDGVSVGKRGKGEREYAVFCHRQGVACDKSPG